VTDEKLIGELSFPAHRRVSSWIMAPAEGSFTAIEMIAIDPAARRYPRTRPRLRGVKFVPDFRLLMLRNRSRGSRQDYTRANAFEPPVMALLQ